MSITNEYGLGEGPSQLDVLGLLDPAQPERNTALKSVEGMIEKDVDFGVAADFDVNISQSPTNGLDPRDSEIVPQAYQAFMDMHEAGKDIVILSSRGGADIARIVQVPGISIVGSGGDETYIVDQQDPTKGESFINPIYQPYAAQITGILGDVRKAFSESFGVIPNDIETSPNLEVATAEETPIIVQRKGFNIEYPEGISLTWNFNQVSDILREQAVNTLEKLFADAFERHTQSLSNQQKEDLKKLCNLNISANSRDIEIRRVSHLTKARAMIQLMREPDQQSDRPKRLPNFQPMPQHDMWVYSGDSIDQDSPAMRAGHTAYVLTKGKRGIIGILSNPNASASTIRGVDLVVPSIQANVAFLHDMATLIKHTYRQ